jgi:hypothetical protein
MQTVSNHLASTVEQLERHRVVLDAVHAVAAVALAVWAVMGHEWPLSIARALKLSGVWPALVGASLAWPVAISWWVSRNVIAGRNLRVGAYAAAVLLGAAATIAWLSLFAKQPFSIGGLVLVATAYCVWLGASGLLASGVVGGHQQP